MSLVSLPGTVPGTAAGQPQLQNGPRNDVISMTLCNMTSHFPFQFHIFSLPLTTHHSPPHTRTFLFLVSLTNVQVLSCSVPLVLHGNVTNMQLLYPWWFLHYERSVSLSCQPTSMFQRRTLWKWQCLYCDHHYGRSPRVHQACGGIRRTIVGHANQLPMWRFLELFQRRVIQGLSKVVEW